MAEQGTPSLEHVEQSLPALFVERLKKQFPTGAYESALRSFANPKPVAIRANTLRCTQEEFLEQIQHSSIQVEPVQWCPGCYLVTEGTIRQIQELPLHEQGQLYIQAASSMLAAHVVQVQPGMRVLDMCAAPGSKTSLLASQMQNKGMMVANDRSRKRLYRLREILQRQGATNVEVICGPGEQLAHAYADCFDRVLVDAPCSGEGRFRLDKPIRLRKWSEQEIRSLAKLQEQLLVSAIRCAAVGGEVVYSTCTFAPEENECVLEKVLSRKSVDVELISIPKNLHPKQAVTPLQSWKGKDISHDVSKAMRIVPDETTTGFFIARLKRLS